MVSTQEILRQLTQESSEIRKQRIQAQESISLRKNLPPVS